MLYFIIIKILYMMLIDLFVVLSFRMWIDKELNGKWNWNHKNNKQTNTWHRLLVIWNTFKQSNRKPSIICPSDWIPSKGNNVLTLKRRRMTPSRTSHLVFPLTPIDPIRYSWLCVPWRVVRIVQESGVFKIKMQHGASDWTSTNLGGIWPTADANNYSHTPTFFT